MHDDNGFFSACQDIAIYFDEGESLLNVFLSTPSNVVFEPIENANVNIMKHVQCDNITHMCFGFIDKVAELFHSIEEEYKNVPSSEKSRLLMNII